MAGSSPSFVGGVVHRTRLHTRGVAIKEKAIANSLAAIGSHLNPQKERKRSLSNIGQDCVTFRVRDEQGQELHFKVSMTIRLQKVFDVYAQKKNVAVTSLKFLFEGERLTGDTTPDDLGLQDSDVVEAVAAVQPLTLPILAAASERSSAAAALAAAAAALGAGAGGGALGGVAGTPGSAMSPGRVPPPAPAPTPASTTPTTPTPTPTTPSGSATLPPAATSDTLPTPTPTPVLPPLTRLPSGPASSVCPDDFDAAVAQLEAFLSSSTAPMVVQITYLNGATVRSGVEIEGDHTYHTLPYITIHYHTIHYITTSRDGKTSLPCTRITPNNTLTTTCLTLSNLSAIRIIGGSDAALR